MLLSVRKKIASVSTTCTTWKAEITSYWLPVNKDNVEIKACPKWARDLQDVDLRQDTIFSRVKMFAKTTNLENFKRGKLLKKLWYCVGGKYNWFHQLGWCELAILRKEIRKLTFRALISPFVGANRGIVGCVWFVCRKMELAIAWYLVTSKTIKINSWALRVPIWKIIFFSRVLRLWRASLM